MFLFIPRSLCALKRVTAKAEHHRFGATQGIRIALASGLYRAEATDGRRAMVVQGQVPSEEPPWPGFRDLPDDACEAIVMPKDLERASKLGDEGVQSLGMVGMATAGNDIFLGLGNDVINTRTVDGRFPDISQVIPKKKPLFTFRVDPKLLGDTLLALAELLPPESCAVQCFYYGDGLPLGFCARNINDGAMIDALVVPLVEATKEEPEDAEAEPAEEEPKPSGRRRTRQEAESNGQTEQASEVVPDATVEESTNDPPAQEANGQEPKPKRRKRSKATECPECARSYGPSYTGPCTH